MINPDARVILLRFIKIRFKPAEGQARLKFFDGLKIYHYRLTNNNGLHDLSKVEDELRFSCNALIVGN